MQSYGEWAVERKTITEETSAMQQQLAAETTLQRVERVPAFHAMTDAQKSFVKSLCQPASLSPHHAMAVIGRLKKYPRGIPLDSFLAVYSKSSHRLVARDIKSMTEAGILAVVPLRNGFGGPAGDGLILTEFMN